MKLRWSLSGGIHLHPPGPNGATNGFCLYVEDGKALQQLASVLGKEQLVHLIEREVAPERAITVTTALDETALRDLLEKLRVMKFIKSIEEWA